MIKFLVFLLFSLTAASYAQTSSVRGTVLDVNGGVVPGAQVTLVAETPPGSRAVLSDDEGGFSFPSLAAGKITITVTAAGLEAASSEIVLQPDEKLIVPAFRLSPAPTI